MRQFYPIKISINIFAVLMLCIVWVSCRDKIEEEETLNDDDSDDIEILMSKSPLKRLAKAIVDGDAATVADFVSYPLKRPAPIPPIKNKEEFIAYFPILFDKTFRKKMRNGTFEEDWETSCRILEEIVSNAKDSDIVYLAKRGLGSRIRNKLTDRIKAVVEASDVEANVNSTSEE